MDILIDRKYCVRHLIKKILKFLVGQAVLQMTQISRSCVVACIYDTTAYINNLLGYFMVSSNRTSLFLSTKDMNLFGYGE